MHRADNDGKSVQDAIDWAVFGIGTLALTTAIAATLLGTGKDRLADAPAPAPAQITSV